MTSYMITHSKLMPKSQKNLDFLDRVTVVQKTNGTSLIYRSKMAFLNWPWRKLKVLPHLCSIEILIKNK